MENDKKYISAVIPSYNRKTELVRALRSVLTQTYPPDEVIVVDDCSKFDVEAYLKDEGVLPNEKITVHRNEQNFGPAYTRNKGVQLAQGSFIAFLDSDDYWDKPKLEKQVQLLEQDKELQLVYCDIWLVEDGVKRRRGIQLLSEGIFEAAIKQGWTAPNPGTMLISKDFFLELGGFDETLQSNQDFDLWFKIGRSDAKITYIPEELAFFSFDASDRITTNFKRKFGGGLLFLKKWEPVIREEFGKKTYKLFKRHFMFGLAFPIFLDRVKRKNFLNAGQIFVKYLFFSPKFYHVLGKKLLRPM